jgi:hypothetical protein
MVKVQDFPEGEVGGNFAKNVARIGERVTERARTQEQVQFPATSRKGNADVPHGEAPSIEHASIGDVHVAEREVVKEAVQSLRDDASASDDNSGAPPTSDNTPSEDSVSTADMLPDYLTGDHDAATHEVEQLLEVALRDDVEKALVLARDKTPFVEDAFHDALVDKVLPLLKEKGVV